MHAESGAHTQCEGSPLRCLGLLQPLCSTSATLSLAASTHLALAQENFLTPPCTHALAPGYTRRTGIRREARKDEDDSRSYRQK